VWEIVEPAAQFYRGVSLVTPRTSQSRISCPTARSLELHHVQYNVTCINLAWEMTTVSLFDCTRILMPARASPSLPWFQIVPYIQRGR
jgi:hypothetical protein